MVDIRACGLATGLLGLNGSLLTHGGKNDDVCEAAVSTMYRWVNIADSQLAGLTDVLLLNLEQFVDFVTDLAIGDLHIVLGDTVVGHQGQETIVGDVDLEQG